MALHKSYFVQHWLKFVLTFIITFFGFHVFSQTTEQPQAADMATGMRSNGKIYVVVAVLCIILAGVFLYLINLDKKIGKLEKEAKIK